MGRMELTGDYCPDCVGVAFTMGRVGPTDGALGAQIRATFEANPNEEWLSAGRSLYAMLRDGNCTQALPVDTFGYSSVGQVTFPYLISSVRMCSLLHWLGGTRLRVSCLSCLAWQHAGHQRERDPVHPWSSRVRRQLQPRPAGPHL